MKIKRKKLTATPLLFTLFTLYLLNYQVIIPSIKEYTKLFVNNPYPTNILILIFTNLLIENNLLYQTNNPSKYINILTIINGFPTPIIEISNLYKLNLISNKEANNYLTFSYLPNIYIFLIPINNLLNNTTITIKLFISIYLSNIIIRILFNNKMYTIKKLNNEYKPFYKTIIISINKSLKIISTIYGTSLFFYLISQILINYIKPSPLIYIIINNIFDLTKGLSTFNIINNSLLKYILILIFLSFGSININFQIKSIINDASLKYSYFILGRFISTIISIIIFLILY